MAGASGASCCFTTGRGRRRGGPAGRGGGCGRGGFSALTPTTPHSPPPHSVRGDFCPVRWRSLGPVPGSRSRCVPPLYVALFSSPRSHHCAPRPPAFAAGAGGRGGGGAPHGFRAGPGGALPALRRPALRSRGPRAWAPPPYKKEPFRSRQGREEGPRPPSRTEPADTGSRAGRAGRVQSPGPFPLPPLPRSAGCHPSPPFAPLDLIKVF